MKEFEIRKAALEAAVRTVAGRRAESDDARVDAVLGAADRYEVWLSQDLRATDSLIQASTHGEHGMCTVCLHVEHDQGACPVRMVGVMRCPCLASRTLSTDLCLACSHPEHASERCPQYGCPCLASRTVHTPCSYCQHALASHGGPLGDCTESVGTYPCSCPYPGGRQ